MYQGSYSGPTIAYASVGAAPKTFYRASSATSNLKGYGPGFSAEVVSATKYMQEFHYSNGSAYQGGTVAPTGEQQVIMFDPSDFLDPSTPHQAFVGCTNDVIATVHETYEKLTGHTLPNDIVIIIGNEEELSKHYTGAWSPSIAGFAINRINKGVSEVFIREDTMDRVMLTIGHELGHVQTKPLKHLIDEEAKAYAFSLAWIDTIKKYNIGGLSPCVRLNPARNGVHNVALDFVLKHISHGNAMRVFHQIASGLLSHAG